MKLVAQGLFGKFPHDPEYIVAGLPGWAVDQAWSLQDRLPLGEHRYVFALPKQRSVVYAWSWPSEDSLGRSERCTFAAIERGRSGPPCDPWGHPWFDDVLLRRRAWQQHQMTFSDIHKLASQWCTAAPLRRLPRQRWGASSQSAVDGGHWRDGVAVLNQGEK